MAEIQSPDNPPDNPSDSPHTPRLAPAANLLRSATSKASTSAPEARRMLVKLAASTGVWRSARRHSSELPANASMARVVSKAVRQAGGERGLVIWPW